MRLEQSRALVFGGGRYPINCARMCVEGDIVAHTHDFIEIALVLGGTAVHSTQENRRTLMAGDAVVIRPAIWHAYDDCRGLDVYNIYVGQELIQRDLAWVLDYHPLALLLLQGGESAEPIGPSASQAVVGWLDQLASHGRESRQVSEMLSRSLLGCVLAELARASFHHDPDPPFISAPVRAAFAAMSGDLAHPWSLGELAAQVNVSPSHLNRQFHAQIDTTPLAWLTRSRAERAATLLVQTDCSVAQIGRLVGWPDPNYASRRFRHVYGRTPTDYRAHFAFGGKN